MHFDLGVVNVFTLKQSGTRIIGPPCILVLNDGGDDDDDRCMRDEEVNDRTNDDNDVQYKTVTMTK